MRTIEFGGDCICGQRLKKDVKKPNAFTPTVFRLECPRCKSRFLISAKLKDVDIKVLELSPVAKQLMEAKLQAEKTASK